MKLIHLLTFVAAFFILNNARGGSIVTLSCSNTNCDFRVNAFCGGTRYAKSVTGFCTRCNKIVGISWIRDGLATDEKNRVIKDLDLDAIPPKPIGTIWTFGVRRKVDLYACPHCKGPFAEFDYVDAMKFKLDEAEQLQDNLDKVDKQLRRSGVKDDVDSARYLVSFSMKTVGNVYCPVCTNKTLTAESTGFYD